MSKTKTNPKRPRTTTTELINADDGDGTKTPKHLKLAGPAASADPIKEEPQQPDRLSALPDDLLVLILSSLSPREIVRTACLSSRWRRLLPLLLSRQDHLSLDPSAAKTAASFLAHLPLRRSLLRHCKISNFHRLGRHKIAHPHPPLRAEVSHILFERLMDSGLQELDLISGRRAKHPIPPPVLASKSLRVLKLSRCLVDRAGAGCPNLRTLQLDRVNLAEGALDGIAASCPGLETLRLVYCKGFKACRIRSASLKHLWFRPSSMQTGIEVDVPNLRTLTLYTRLTIEQLVVRAPRVRKAYLHLARSRRRGIEMRLWSFLAAATDLVCLTLRGNSVGLLSQESNGESFPKPFQMLKILSISLDVQLELHASFLVKLLESCPHLQELNISNIFAGGENDECLFGHKERLRRLPCLPCNLEQIKLSGFQMSRFHSKLARLLLWEAKKVKKMTLKLPLDSSQSTKEAAKDLLSARKGSIRILPSFHNHYWIQLEVTKKKA